MLPSPILIGSLDTFAFVVIGHMSLLWFSKNFPCST